MKTDPRQNPDDLEKTLLESPLAADSNISSRGDKPHAHIEMASLASAQLENETRALLRKRLFAAAVVLFASVGLFLLRSFFLSDAPVRGLHALVTMALGVSIVVLWISPGLTLSRLRIGEIGLFAVTALFLGAYEYNLVLNKALEGNPIYELAAMKSCVLYFFGVIMLYGTFIPNTWQRAACIIIPMSLVPGSVMLLLRMRSDAFEHFAEEVINFEQVSDHIGMLTLGAISSIYGAHIIHTLRQEAFKARQLGQYRLKELIGAGGMGEVYLAEHQLLKRPCAIKLIRPGSQADPQALARFEREVRTTAKLSHWNTIDVFDYGRTDDGTFYYVMDYLPGLSLADLVRHYGPMPPSRVVHLLRQTCQALREAHDVGFIHRDIKPANIFAAKRGGVYDVAKLLDFGLVKPVEQAQNAHLTQTGTLSGSPLYMSPEQAAATEEADARSDIYSLGITAYFLLTGHTPFEGTNPLQVLIAHARDVVPPPSERQPGIPADLEQIVLKCLAKEPADRYPDAESLEKALAACEDAGQWNDEDAARWWHETRGAMEHVRH